MSRYFLPIAKPGSLVLAVLAALASVSAEPAAKEAAGGLSLFGRLVGPEGRPVVKRFYGISIAVPLGKMVDRKAVPPVRVRGWPDRCPGSVLGRVRHDGSPAPLSGCRAQGRVGSRRRRGGGGSWRCAG